MGQKLRTLVLEVEALFHIQIDEDNFFSQYSHAYLGAELLEYRALTQVCECFIRWPYIIDGPFISAILRSPLPRQEYSSVSSIKKPKISI